MVSEIYKHRAHAGQPPAMYHLRQTRGLEVDCIVETGTSLLLMEAKSGATVRGEFLRPLAELSAELEERDAGRSITRRLVYGGDEYQRRTQGEVVPWRSIHELKWY